MSELPDEVDVDGRVDSKGVRYVGKARRQPDGTWRALADVGGALCLVECTITEVYDRPECDHREMDVDGQGRMGWCEKCGAIRLFPPQGNGLWTDPVEHTRFSWARLVDERSRLEGRLKEAIKQRDAALQLVPRSPSACVDDQDLDGMDRDALIAEVKKLRAGVRHHRDASGHNLCWWVPELWSILPETENRRLPTVPPWPEFIQRCAAYRASLDDCKSST